MIPHDLPDYVERGGRQVWRPPYTARKAEIYGFVIPVQRAAIDGLLQRDLVEPALGAVDYRCAHESIVVTFAAMGQLASGDPTDSARGYLPELEVSVWCLAADMLAGGRLVWYLPYVFTDTGQTVATGREVYGYPKQIGYFGAGYPDTLAAAGTTTVEALAIDPFGPAQAASRRPMISAERKATAKGVIGSGGSAFAGLADLISGGLAVDLQLAFGSQPSASAAITPAGGPKPPQVSQGPSWMFRRVLDKLTGRGLSADPEELVAAMVENPTLVFLKQFRDVTCPTKACYQAVVEAPIVPHLAGAAYEELDPAGYELKVHEWASHPLAGDLGVPAAQGITPEHVFHTTFAFDISLGLEVWRAPT